MDNKLYLNQMKLIYDSLKYFEYEQNYLILRIEKEFKIPLIHTNLSHIKNTDLFLLPPKEIFQIIYMLELLHKNQLSENEINFIKSYTEKYLKISDDVKNNAYENTNRLWSLELPINLAYNDYFINNQTALLIMDMINNHAINQENSRSNYPTLKLIKGENPNFEFEIEDDNIKALKEAGFTTLFIITSTVLATCLYIIYFISNN